MINFDHDDGEVKDLELVFLINDFICVCVCVYVCVPQRLVLFLFAFENTMFNKKIKKIKN
jgi:hypothetical protein